MGTANKLTPELQAYIRDVGVREHPTLVRCRVETHRDFGDRAEMQIAPEQGAFFALLIRLLGARRTLEIGVFTGYSSLSVALALPRGGVVTACEVSEEFAELARSYWDEAGVRDRIDLRMGPALDTLDALLADGHAGEFDFTFIDADKTGYDAYYEAALELSRPGGVIALDNTLWGGAVIDEADQSEDTLAIRTINRKLARDDRVDLVLTTIGDGVTLARKR